MSAARPLGARRGIVNDPNRPDNPQYILRLIAKVVSVSLETVEIVDRLSGLGKQSQFKMCRDFLSRQWG